MRMRTTTALCTSFKVVCLSAGFSVNSAAAEPFVAGTTPDRRPEGSPVIREFEKTDAWRAAAATGVSQSFPLSLKFLDDQGAWFTPFIRPGMTGPYDIRGWHTGAAKGRPQSNAEHRGPRLFCRVDTAPFTKRDASATQEKSDVE